MSVSHVTGEVVAGFSRSADTAVKTGTVAPDGLAALRASVGHGAPAGVGDAIGDAVDGIGDAVGRATNVKLHNDPEYVSAVILSLKGQLPTDEATKAMTKRFGFNPLEGVPDQLKKYGQSDTAKQVNNTFRQVWSGLWLKFEDATFPMRLRGALNDQQQAIEGMTRAIQNYERVIMEGEDSIKAIKTNIETWTKDLKAELAKPADQQNSELISRLTTKIESGEVRLEARNKIVGEMKVAQEKLAVEQKFLRQKAAEDAERAEMLLAQRKLNKSLEGLDDKLNDALGKMTDLESDIARIEGRTKQVGDAARRAAQQLADSGGLG